MQRWEQWRRRRRADTPAVSAGQAGDGSLQPVDATGAARVMLERAFPQAGQQAQVEQTSVQGQAADGQGVAQNTAAPVVDGQPVYSDIALADYMAKQAAQQKFGDVTGPGAEAQQTGMIEAGIQPELEHTTTVTPEENVVASEKNNGTIGTETGQTAAFVDTTVIPTYLTVIDGKVGGKVPVEDFKSIRKISVKNSTANSITLGKYTKGADSYIARAGTDSAYFDLGNKWSEIQDKYDLTDSEMFEFFNKPALEDAVISGKRIRFSHNPLEYGGSFLADEWEYIKGLLKLIDDNLIFKGGFWYVE